jgi:hypothetical protein
MWLGTAAVQMKILERYKQNPELASTDIATDERGRKTNTKNKGEKGNLRRCLTSSLARQCSGNELVPKAVNSSKVDRVCGVHLQLLAESQDVVIDSST